MADTSGPAGPSSAQETHSTCWKCHGSGIRPCKTKPPLDNSNPSDSICPVCKGKGKTRGSRPVAFPSHAGTDRQTTSSLECSRAGIDLHIAAPEEPRQGDLVYVVGHGPAVILEVQARGRQRFLVKYPNGTCYHVAREQVSWNGESRPGHLEYLGRAFDDAGRNIHTPSAMFSLVATMVGGGVLSLPYAISQSGLVLGILALFFSGGASAWTLDMLVDCARHTGLDTFELVGYAAFGKRCRELTVGLVFTVCWLVLIAYFVLLGDLLVPVAELISPELTQVWSPESLRRLLVCIATAILAPMCFKSNLHALRFMCFGSVGSVVVVGLMIASRALQSLGERHSISIQRPDHSTTSVIVLTEMSMWPEDWTQAVYVFPIFGLSFLCHFNALPTHQELYGPTRYRIRRVFTLTVLVTSLLYLFVGISGYLYASSCTCGNILLNFDRRDPLIAAGRAALGCVLMLNFPLICQPCRNSFYRLAVGMVGSASCFRRTPQQISGTSPSEITASEASGSLARVFVYNREETAGVGRRSGLPPFDSFIPKDETVHQGISEASRVTHFAITFLLLGSALLVSLVMQSVLVVWSLLGSSVCFMIAFVLPAAFWYRIVGQFASAWQRCFVLSFIGLVTVVAIACTVQTILKLKMPACPLRAGFAAHEPLLNILD